MGRLVQTTDRVPRDRLAELVSAAAYGSVLVLAALTVVGVSEVALGHGAELVAGVGLATWGAHLFAELLGGHVHHPTPLHRSEIKRAAIDGSPIFAATVLPAAVLMLGRLDVINPATARIVAILIAIVQLLSIGGLVAQVAPSRPSTIWTFAGLVGGVGVAVVLLTVLLGH